MLAALLLAAAAPTLADADAFMRRVYAPYVAGPNAPSPAHDPAVFTAEMLALIARDEALAAGEDPILDGDPICYCQDHQPLRDLVIAVRPAGRGRAIAAVRFNDGQGVNRMTFRLRADAAGWRIADIDTPQDGSLAALIRDGIARRERRRVSSSPSTGR